MLWAIRTHDTEDDTCSQPQLYRSLIEGKARFGWSYKCECDLHKVSEKLEQFEAGSGEQLNEPEQKAWKHAHLLLQIEPGDFIFFLRHPDRAHCCLARVVGRYEFDEGIQCSAFGFFAEDERDFRHYIPVEYLGSFMRVAEFVPDALQIRLRLPGALKRFHVEEELVDEVLPHLEQEADNDRLDASALHL